MRARRNGAWWAVCLAFLAALAALSAGAPHASAQDRTVDRLLARAEDLRARGQLRAARTSLQRAVLRAGSDDPRAALALAAMLPDDVAGEPDVALAEQAREVAGALTPHLSEPSGAPSGEAEQVRRAIARAHGWATAVAGDTAAAVRALSAQLGLQDHAAHALLIRLATLAVSRGELPVARDALLAAHRAVPQDDDAVSDLGAVELALGAPENAVLRFGRVLSRRPTDLTALRDLAGALTAAGRPEEALPILRRGLTAHPAEHALRLELSRAALEAGEFGLAERAARESIAALGPEDARGHAALGAALVAQDRREPARIAFEEALRRDPSERRARQGLEALLAE